MSRTSIHLQDGIRSEKDVGVSSIAGSVQDIPMIPLSASSSRTIRRPSIASNAQRTISAGDDHSEANLTIVSEAVEDSLSKTTAALIILSVTLINALSSMLAGIITVGIPAIAVDVGLDKSLLLWPASIYSLVCGCTLLISGSVSDVLGSKLMYLLGCFLQSACNLGTGLSKTGGQLILFQGLGGLAISFCLPSAVSIVTKSFQPGQRRNIAFACMGGGQPVGFAIGLILGGVLTDTIGWRWGPYLAAMLNLGVLVLAIWTVPKDEVQDGPAKLKRFVYDVDWVGALIASTSLAMLSFVFAAVSTSTASISHPLNISLLVTSIALIPAFIVWVHRQESLNRPALIPNSLWRNPVFRSICISVFLTWGSFNATEQLLTFYFQYAQGLSALQSSLRFLAAPASGIAMNVAVGLLVQHVRGDLIIGIGAVLSLVSPLLMALAKPGWSYWAGAFPAVLLNPTGADSLFTISNLVIAQSFSPKTQGLAGGVFNTVSQIGKSVGLALSAVIANSLTAKSAYADKSSPDALDEGYRGAFLFCFGLSVAALFIGSIGLRKAGKVGEKRD